MWLTAGSGSVGLLPVLQCSIESSAFLFDIIRSSCVTLIVKGGLRQVLGWARLNPQWRGIRHDFLVRSQFGKWVVVGTRPEEGRFNESSTRTSRRIFLSKSDIAAADSSDLGKPLPRWWLDVTLFDIRSSCVTLGVETSKLRQYPRWEREGGKYRIEWMEWLVLELCTHIHLVRTDAQYPYNVFNIHVYTDTIFKQFSTGLARSTIWRCQVYKTTVGLSLEAAASEQWENKLSWRKKTWEDALRRGIQLKNERATGVSFGNPLATCLEMKPHRAMVCTISVWSQQDPELKHAGPD
jgi:hypothetical protein